MKPRDLLYETLAALVANRVRSLLTVLGIVIGIAAVVAITALIDGVKMQLVAQLGLNAARVVSITCWPPGNQTLDQDDVAEMSRDLVADYEFVTGFTGAGVERASSATASVEYPSLTACKPEYFEVMGSKPAQGRLFTSEEEEDAAMVVVLGGSSVEELFGSPDAEVVGQGVRIGNDQYTVVGALPNEQGYQDYNLLYLPYSTAQTRIMGQQGYNQLSLLGFAREGSDMYAVAASTEAYLRDKYHITADNENGGNSQDGYVYVSTAQESIDRLDSTMATFQLLALAVAGISLLVGGIGIMNMMLTNVTERIREIGLRKALGARRADITTQFLLESVTICLAGGAFGIAAGYGGAWLLAGFAGGALGYESLVPVVSPAAVGMATGICVGIGVVFGWYPARRAARLDPVESLRYQ